MEVKITHMASRLDQYEEDSSTTSSDDKKENLAKHLIIWLSLREMGRYLE